MNQKTKSFIALLQKEVLEYKTSFIKVPVLLGSVLVSIMVLSALSADAQFGSDTAFIDIHRVADMPGHIREWFLYSLMNDVTLPLRLILILVSINYVTGAFYNERKDGSDLFWRSMPITQSAQVTAKWVTVSMVLPSLYFIVIVAAQLCCLLLASYLAMGEEVGIIQNIWMSANPLKVWVLSFSFILLDVVWLAPVYLWLLLCSSFANRSPLLTAVIPILILAVVESSVLDSSLLIKGVFWHSCPQELMIWVENLKHRVLPSELVMLQLGPEESLIPSVGQWKETMVSPTLWIGAGLASTFFVVTVWVRNFREET